MRPAHRAIFFTSATLALLAVCSGPSMAAWPARVFAPYVLRTADDPFSFSAFGKQTGQRWFILAFVITGKDGNPAWDGSRSLADDHLAEPLKNLRATGGDAAVSFGGEGGTELALSEKNDAALLEKYTRTVDSRHFTWADFDIEGDFLKNDAANHRRNIAVARLQADRPGLRVSYTLPASPDGMPDSALKLLADAKAAGVRVERVNVMTMDFGPFYSKGKKLADVCIATAEKSHRQCAGIDRRWTLGLCPMIGVNDVKSEVFNRADADQLFEWAEPTAWVSGLSFWSANNDAGNLHAAYTERFKTWH